MVFDVKKYSGFNDDRSFLLFLKEFFNAVLDDDETRLSDVPKALYYHLDVECQLWFEAFAAKQKDFGFLCYNFAKIFIEGNKDDQQKVAELVHCFIKAAKQQESNFFFCFPVILKKHKPIPENSVLFLKNTVSFQQKQPLALSSSAVNQRKLRSLKAEPVLQKASTVFREVKHVGPPLPERVGQNYAAIKAECLENGCLFEDPEFPANSSSIYYCKKPAQKIKWLRPSQIVDDPHFFVDGESRFDVCQGELGNCWLLAALSTLTLHKQLFFKVVDPTQSFSRKYAGVFHFKFWQYGKWIDVVIDDRLPTSNGKLLYLRSSEKNEFWSALLEKAYAKLYGSYEALIGGWTNDALADLTGGLTEVIDIEDPPQNLQRMIYRGIKMGALFGCSTGKQTELPTGIFDHHAYSITGIQTVKGKDGPTHLIRIRNPWGNEKEFKGQYSDNSPEWDNISLGTKQRIDLKIKNDGESWMTFDDFQQHFESVEVCHIGPDVMQNVHHHQILPSESRDNWVVKIIHGTWKRGLTAGGSTKTCYGFFANNPQYLIEVDNREDTSTIIIGLLQKYRRELIHEGLEDLMISFTIYEMGKKFQGKKLDQNFIEKTSPFFESKAMPLREITARLRVPSGKYILIPATQEKNEEANFMIRIFSDGLIETSEL